MLSCQVDPWQWHTHINPGHRILCSSHKGCDKSLASPSLVSMPRLEPGLDGYLCRETLLRSRQRIAFRQPRNNSFRDPAARLEIIQGFSRGSHYHFHLGLVKIKFYFSCFRVASLCQGVRFHAFCAVTALGWVCASPSDNFQPAGCSEEEQVCLLPLPKAGSTPEHRCNKHDLRHPLRTVRIL